MDSWTRRAGSQCAPHVLVGVSCRRDSAGPMRVAAELAAEGGSGLLIVHVRTTLASLDGPDDTPEWLFANAVSALYDVPVRWRIATVVGVPARTLAAIASCYRVSALVVGEPRPGRAARLRRVLEGSVAKRLTCLQSAPVVVVPSAEIETLRRLPAVGHP